MIFFDLDDTILNTAKTNLLIFERAQMDLHIDMDADEFRGRIRTALRSRMIRHMDFAYNETIGIDPLDYLLMEEPYEEERLELFKNGVYDDVKDILGETTKEEFFSAFLKRRFDYTEAIDGMLELIKDLKSAGHIHYRLRSLLRWKQTSLAGPFPEPVEKAGRTYVSAGATITQPRSLLRRMARCTDRTIT